MERREKGTGTLTQRKDGQWEGRIRYRDEGHKLIVKACFAPTKEECEARMQEIDLMRLRRLSGLRIWRNSVLIDICIKSR